MTNRSSWIFFNVVGYTVAGAAFGALQRARYQRYYEVVTSASDAVSIATLNTAKSLAVFGILLGTAQWLALWRHRFARWWIPATAVGWSAAGVAVGVISGLTLGSISSMGPHRSAVVTVLGVSLATVTVAFVPSAAQWLLLRRRVHNADRWPLVNLAGLVAGLTVGGVVVRWLLVEVVPMLTPYDFPSAKALVCVGALTGLVYGATTARWVDRHLVGNPVSNPVSDRGRAPAP